MAQQQERQDSVNWTRFGLDPNVDRSQSQSYARPSAGQQVVNAPSAVKCDEANTTVKELFDEEQGDHESQKPWWKANFFVREPLLFGTWDGVFTSCMLNIFGVVIFLRTGWMVGNAGIGLSLLIVVMTLLVALAPALSAIGVCERCHVESGGVYFLLAHVLGQRIGGTVGILYSFGQAVGISLFCAGFGESMAETINWQSPWAVRVISLCTATVLLVVVLAGVKWVVKLQLLLLAILMLSVLDFVVGTFAHTDKAAGFTGYHTANMENNAPPDYSAGENFFTVFGVFFPSATGVLAGINMSGDLKDPSTNIPAGTLAALGFSGILYILFVILLGAVCTREALLTDYMIASKVSLVGVLFLFGLYVSSLSSCLGAQYGAPRVLQCISWENVVPLIKPLGKGRGPNKEPYIATISVAGVAMAFILIGNLNALAPIVTMPFLLTYAAIDYAYFKLAMSYDLRQKQKLADRATVQNKATSPSSKLVALDLGGNYGTADENKHDFGSVRFSPDLTEKDDSKEKENANKDQCPEISDGDEKTPLETNGKEVSGNEADNSTAVTVSDTAPLVENVIDAPFTSKQGSPKKEKIYKEERQIKWEIEKQPSSYYSDLCNRWVSLAGVVASILIMFLINWGYALANISVALIVYIYIGQANPGLSKGVASDFSFTKWLQSLWETLTRKSSPEQQIVVVPNTGIPYGLSTYQLTEENADFAYRDKRHHSSVVTTIGPQ